MCRSGLPRKQHPETHSNTRKNASVGITSMAGGGAAKTGLHDESEQQAAHAPASRDHWPSTHLLHCLHSVFDLFQSAIWRENGQGAVVAADGPPARSRNGGLRTHTSPRPSNRTANTRPRSNWYIPRHCADAEAVCGQITSAGPAAQWPWTLFLCESCHKRAFGTHTGGRGRSAAWRK